jgi:hypothetical protein
MSDSTRGYYRNASEAEVTQALAELGIYRRPGHSRDTPSGLAPRGSVDPVTGHRAEPTVVSDPARHAAAIAEMREAAARPAVDGGDVRALSHQEFHQHLAGLGLSVPASVSRAARNDPDGGRSGDYLDHVYASGLADGIIAERDLHEADDQ